MPFYGPAFYQFITILPVFGSISYLFMVKPIQFYDSTEVPNVEQFHHFMKIIKRIFNSIVVFTSTRS